MANWGTAGMYPIHTGDRSDKLAMLKGSFALLRAATKIPPQVSLATITMR
jgi:hypothetical protein